MRESTPGRPAWAQRTLTMLATLVVFAASLVGAGTTVTPAYAAACTGTKGVTVVVDFSKLGGKIVTACDPTNPATGLAALTGAGFTYAFVPRFPGFVCTIDALPNPCNGAPISAYWSYWHAKPDGKWIYSSVGAGTYKPPPGSIQGWAFGAGAAPGSPPP